MASGSIVQHRSVTMVTCGVIIVLGAAPRLWHVSSIHSGGCSHGLVELGLHGGTPDNHV